MIHARSDRAALARLRLLFTKNGAPVQPMSVTSGPGGPNKGGQPRGSLVIMKPVYVRPLIQSCISRSR
jgi:hypothetical protein